MPQTLAQNVVHIVFSTKNRERSLSEELQPKAWAYLAGICHNYRIVVHAIGGTDDHIHLLVQIPPLLSLAKAIQTIKSNSSRWISEQKRGFSWQRGYGAFSVSASLLPTVVRYIRNQKTLHRKMSFETEFLAMLNKHGVSFDREFIFD